MFVLNNFTSYLSIEGKILMSIVEKAFQAQLKQVGSEVGISPWVTVDQTMIDKFADVTMDPQFIHVDEKRAKLETPFGGTIAHGFFKPIFGIKICNRHFSSRTMAINGD